MSANQPARRRWHLRQITDEIEPSERGRHVLGARRKNERETKKPRCAKPSAPKRSRRRMKPILHWKKSKAEAQLVAGFQSSVFSLQRRGLVRSRALSHWVAMKEFFRVTCIAVRA